MNASLFLGALAVLAAPAAKPSKPIGPPPKIVLISPSGGIGVHLLVTEARTVQESITVTVVEDGKPVPKLQMREVTVLQTKHVPLADAGATFRTAGGKALTAAEAADKLKDGGHLIIPAEREPIDAAYTMALAADAIVVEYAKEGKLTISASVHNPTQPAPRFLAVKADEKGVLRIPAAGTREVTVKVPTSKVVDGVTKIEYIDSKQSVLDLVPTPYDDVKPTVTTADSKPVMPHDAKKRLSAGVIVIVSANGKPVGEPFLKLVKPDTLVLSAEKMVHPAFHQMNRPLPVPAVAPVAAPPRIGR